MASSFYAVSLPALVKVSVVAFRISVLISIAIALLIVVFVAEIRRISAIGMLEIVTMCWTEAVPRAAVILAVVQPILIAILPCRTYTIASTAVNRLLAIGPDLIESPLIALAESVSIASIPVIIFRLEALAMPRVPSSLAVSIVERLLVIVAVKLHRDHRLRSRKSSGARDQRSPQNHRLQILHSSSIQPDRPGMNAILISVSGYKHAW